MSDHVINGFRLHRFAFPRNRAVGDSQTRSTMHHLVAIEILTASGLVGLGFCQSLSGPFAPKLELVRVFEAEVFKSLNGADALTFQNRLTRPRGGNQRAVPHGFAQAVDQALWDIAAKAAGLPLYRLLGGTRPEVDVYGSDLGFHSTEAELAALVEFSLSRGFKRFKVKVGHPDIEWDLARLDLIRRLSGNKMLLMIDANEAWSGKEAVRALQAYRTSGFDIYWAEDPCARDDFEGLQSVRRGVPDMLVNSGEYLDLKGKMKLIESGCADIINCHGVITATMRAAWLAHEHSQRVSIGNTPLEMGVHLAAAQPDRTWMEYSFHNTGSLVVDPVEIRDGKAFAPDRPGHGLSLAAGAVARLSSDGPDTDPDEMDEAAPSVVDFSNIGSDQRSIGGPPRI